MKSRDDAQTTLFALSDFEEQVDQLVLPDIPDWPESERLKMEKEGLGFFISGHPLNGYAKVMEKFSTANTLSLGETAGRVILAGVIHNLNISRTKKGDLMARGIFEDLYGTAPVIFFPKCFSEYEAAINGDGPVIIKARVDLSEDENDQGMQVDLLAEEVYPIEQAEAVFASRILVRLKESDTAEQIRALKGGIAGFKGACPLSFEIATGQAVINIEAGKTFAVDPCKALIDRVQDILGPARIEIQ